VGKEKHKKIVLVLFVFVDLILRYLFTVSYVILLPIWCYLIILPYSTLLPYVVLPLFACGSDDRKLGRRQKIRKATEN